MELFLYITFKFYCSTSYEFISDTVQFLEFKLMTIYYVPTRDEFELEFSGSSKPKL